MSCLEFICKTHSVDQRSGENIHPPFSRTFSFFPQEFDSNTTADRLKCIGWGLNSVVKILSED